MIIKTQTSIFDLSAFASVLVVKESSFEPATSYADALARLGGDEAKLLAAINSGLEDSAREALRNDSTISWKVVDEEGNPGADFAGVAADEDKVNSLRNQLAKSFSERPWSDLTAEEKRALKADALETIRTTPSIRKRLEVSAGK